MFLFLLISPALCRADAEPNEQVTLSAPLPVFSLNEPYSRIGELKAGSVITLLGPETEHALRIRFNLNENELAEAQARKEDIRQSVKSSQKNLPASSTLLSATIADLTDVAIAFSPQGEALSLILREIGQARESIDLAAFYLSHPELVAALCFVANRRAVKVRAFVDVAAASPTDRHVLDKLARGGVNVFVVNVPRGKMHLKSAVFDKRTVITGAANWTPQAFEWNIEDTLVIRSEELAARYIERMENMLGNAETHYDHEKEGRGGDVSTFPRPARRQPSGVALTTSRPDHLRSMPAAQVWFSPDNKGAEVLAGQIRAATSSVVIAMYLLTDDGMKNALIEKARSADAPIRLIVSAEMLAASSLPAMRELHSAFQEAGNGSEIAWFNQGRSHMHLKTAVIDARHVWTGSANWTDSALKVNVEDLLYLDSRELAAAYLRFLRDVYAVCEAFQPAGQALDDVTVAETRTATGFLTGLPPTGPRTNWTGTIESRPFPPFEIEASVQYLPDDEYFPVLLRLIRTARQSVLISMYVFPEPKNNEPLREQLVRELERAAKRGVYVRMALNMPSSTAAEAGQAHEDWAERLRAQGIDVRLHVPGSPLHDKLVVVDLAKILIGSHNWTEGALSGKKARESTALLVLNKQDIRWAEYITGLETVSDMRTTAHWEEELRRIRHLTSLRSKQREAFLQELEMP